MTVISITSDSFDDLDEIATRLNSRPRKTLDYDTPADRLQALLH